jgi:hypothetical protein
VRSPAGDEFGGYVVPVPIDLDNGPRFTLLCERFDGAICEQCGDTCRPDRFAPTGHGDCRQRATYFAALCGGCVDVFDWERKVDGG